MLEASVGKRPVILGIYLVSLLFYFSLSLEERSERLSVAVMPSPTTVPINLSREPHTSHAEKFLCSQGPSTDRYQLGKVARGSALFFNEDRSPALTISNSALGDLW